MTSTGIDVFDTTVQKTNAWVRDIMDELHWDDRHKAFQAMRVVLENLRDRLTVEEAAQFGAQLPVLVRGFYYEGWRPAHKPEKIRDRQEFLSRIQDSFATDPSINPDRVTRAVFKVLARRISDGEIEDIRRVMPPELEELWSDAA
jgi:uncharacterized protein (DUF2267 family)